MIAERSAAGGPTMTGGCVRSDKALKCNNETLLRLASIVVMTVAGRSCAAFVFQTANSPCMEFRVALCRGLTLASQQTCRCIPVPKRAC